MSLYNSAKENLCVHCGQASLNCNAHREVFFGYELLLYRIFLSAKKL